MVILLKIKASGNYSRLEKSVSVGEGLGAREGRKEGPCGCLGVPDVGLVLAAAAASVKFVRCCGQLDPAPFPGG